MIELTFNTIFIFYLGITLSAVLGVWVYSHYRMRHKTIFSTEKDLFVCEYCQFAYVEENTKQLNRCPQCGLYNKQNTFQQIQDKNQKT